MKSVNERLLETFLKLLAQDGKEVTISKLCKHANVNRTTFYRNFSSIEDLFKFFILKDLTFRYQGSGPFDFEYAFKKIFLFIDTHIQILSILFNSAYYEKLLHFIKGEIFSYQLSAFNRIDVNNVLDANEKELVSTFYADGITSIFVFYIQSKQKNRGISKDVFILQALRIVKGYIERQILRKSKDQIEPY
jgi:AcrR family transcriptional regulator